MRNPPESRHTPGSADGCTILVKLWQFDLNDRVDTKLRSHQLIYSPVTNHSGRSTTELHHDAREHVCMQHWQPGTQVLESFTSGVKLFVLGGVSPNKMKLHRRLVATLTLRERTAAEVGSDGAHVWLKSGHLRSVFIQPPAK